MAACLVCTIIPPMLPDCDVSNMVYASLPNCTVVRREVKTTVPAAVTGLLLYRNITLT